MLGGAPWCTHCNQALNRALHRCLVSQAQPAAGSESLGDVSQDVSQGVTASVAISRSDFRGHAHSLAHARVSALNSSRGGEEPRPSDSNAIEHVGMLSSCPADGTYHLTRLPPMLSSLVCMCNTSEACGFVRPCCTAHVYNVLQECVGKCSNQ